MNRVLPWLVVIILTVPCPVLGQKAHSSTKPVALELLSAIHGHNIGKVKALLDSGVSPNSADSQGITALIKAATVGDEEIAGLLLRRGAKVNAKTRIGWTALMRAAVIGDLAVGRHCLAVLSCVAKRTAV